MSSGPDEYPLIFMQLEKVDTTTQQLLRLCTVVAVLSNRDVGLR